MRVRRQIYREVSADKTVVLLTLTDRNGKETEEEAELTAGSNSSLHDP